MPPLGRIVGGLPRLGSDIEQVLPERVAAWIVDHHLIGVFACDNAPLCIVGRKANFVNKHVRDRFCDRRHQRHRAAGQAVAHRHHAAFCHEPKVRPERYHGAAGNRRRHLHAPEQAPIVCITRVEPFIEDQPSGRGDDRQHIVHTVGRVDRDRVHDHDIAGDIPEAGQREAGERARDRADSAVIEFKLRTVPRIDTILMREHPVELAVGLAGISGEGTVDE